MLEEVPDFTEVEKQEFLKAFSGVAVSSDAFFPFRDSIDVARVRSPVPLDATV